MSGEVKPTGGCAFPFNAGEFGIEPSPGMTLRDWFAGQALAGIAFGMMQAGYEDGQLLPSAIYAGIAKSAFSIADAMIAERSK